MAEVVDHVPVPLINAPTPALTTGKAHVKALTAATPAVEGLPALATVAVKVVAVAAQITEFREVPDP
jgi:hypothetical protein